jgi:hypothetical protein
MVSKPIRALTNAPLGPKEPALTIRQPRCIPLAALSNTQVDSEGLLTSNQAATGSEPSPHSDPGRTPRTGQDQGLTTVKELSARNASVFW